MVGVLDDQGLEMCLECGDWFSRTWYDVTDYKIMGIPLETKCDECLNWEETFNEEESDSD